MPQNSERLVLFTQKLRVKLDQDLNDPRLGEEIPNILRITAVSIALAFMEMLEPRSQPKK